MQQYSSKYNKQAILLVNLGTPDNYDTKSIKRYLKEFLSDPRVIEANPILWKIILNLIILPIRAKKNVHTYKTVWNKQHNKSPLLFYTENLADKLDKKLDNYIVDYALRYGNPSIESKIKSLQDQGATEIIIFPLYPQYSATTTATVYDEVYRVLSKLRWQPTIKGINPYYDNKFHIQTISQQIKEHLKKLDSTPDTVLFSFHGLPKEYFDKGDPYYCHCYKTYRLVKEELQNEYPNIDFELSFQSRFGPKKWLEPYTTVKLEEFAKQNKSVVVIAPGFSADCLETLEELAISEKENFIKKGGKEFSLIPCLNDSNQHVDMLYNIIDEEICLKK
ncbi:ferrochelatase [Francisella tularensis subsp. holarctica FSC022]|uniref:ferrochelatase n=1 Tax=Francisella tularensis TaxID=263 RepID=UPI00015D7A84|nr:ferrochelatase [Francisella tularensis]EDO66272.1 ferrochelatase [Francisella tularensis subsp. holarctica FSC022]KIP31770.1 ferrochelatase [Francisella tularensis subsp. holarctica]MCC9171996.1 ferrochelatase [Francisella tularensis]OCQ63855.1 ferrochelatase [Francisella tularensis]OPH24151.1 ferrochelatase [Francisella tularensis subsp. holarctica FSC022]